MRTPALPGRPVIHAEWIKTRSLRSTLWTLAAVFLATVGVTVLGTALTDGEADGAAGDALFPLFQGVAFGQIAALAFGATAVACEFQNGALRITLCAVPDRTRFYLAKTAVIGALSLGVGTSAGLASYLCGQGFRHAGTAGPGAAEVGRAILGSGAYLASMALLAAGLTALVRSGTAVLGILIPFVLIVSYVVGDVAGGAAEFLPDRAGQLVLHQGAGDALGPWSGLGVTALWSAGALVAGCLAVRRRDA
ncbi:ABC transporter permease subunit [Streptomyces sp. NPDC089919]|uniref:ABC transporter permease subunit n=1 Tax=Streptomyces sp. NPDC089919 TaxID=3155188 RepID=UPI003433CB22